jgi:DNA-directed RNA polymerase subunit delta
MKRIIKDYKTISQEHADLIAQHFPNGFENENLISFTTPKGEFIKALEIRTEDTIYLFKVDKNMQVDNDDDNDGVSVDSSFDSFKGDDSGSDDDDDEDDDNDAADDSDDEEDED